MLVVVATDLESHVPGLVSLARSDEGKKRDEAEPESRHD